MSNASRENVIRQEDGGFADRKFLHIGRYNRRDFVCSMHANILTSLRRPGFRLLVARYKRGRSPSPHREVAIGDSPFGTGQMPDEGTMQQNDGTPILHV